MSVEAVVNNKYQKSNSVLGQPNCTSSSVSATQIAEQQAFPVFVQPNPFSAQTTLYFANSGLEPMSVTLTDMTGKVRRTYTDMRSESVTLERGNLPAGLYLYTVQSSRMSRSGKLIAW